MEERKFVQFKKDEYAVKEYVKNSLGKGRISSVRVEYTPVGEKIIVATNKPGLVIGRRGERINELTTVLKRRFKLENPHIEIKEITKPEYDAQIMADEIALSLERLGSLRFKIIAYRMLRRIMDANAAGVEIILAGKLPSERAKSWRFASGYLKKTGDTAKIVDKAQALGKTNAGVVGVKVSILSPDKKIHDQIIIDKDIKEKIKIDVRLEEEEVEEKPKKKRKRKTKKKEEKKPAKKKEKKTKEKK
jgi:small subunit ribosomal protein S3